MKLDKVHVPIGYMEGMPSLRITIDGNDDLDDIQAQVVKRSIGPGLASIEVVCDEWDNDKLDRFFVRLFELCPDNRIWSRRHAGSSVWCPVNIDWVIDVTEKFEDQGMERDAFIRTLHDASHTPPVSEVVWWRPNVEHLTRWHLGQVADVFNPEMGMWVYVDDDTHDLAMQIVGGLMGNCGVRHARGLAERPW